MSEKFKYSITKDKNLLVNDPALEDKEYIISYPYSQIFLTKEMQRLADISQNGASRYDYPGLENNNRLLHSIEAYHMMEKMLDKIDSELITHKYAKIPDRIRTIALLGISVHDIGHGPGSHLSERIFGKSHEERTRDILESPKTEIHNELVNILGNDKDIKLIEGFITAKIENLQTGNDMYDKYLKLIASFTSNLIDADKLAYLQADPYYAGKKVLFSANDVIDSLSVTVNADAELVPVVKESGLGAIEAMRNYRAQLYRDLYHTKSDQIMDYYYPVILDLCKNDLEDSIKENMPKEIQSLINNPQNIETDEFLKLTESPILHQIKIVKNSTRNETLAYICNLKRITNDTRVCRTKVSIEEAKSMLSEIFGKDMSNTNSVFTTNSKIQVRKKKEDFYIDCGQRGIISANSEEADMLLEPKQDVMTKKIFGFNTEVLRQELGLSIEEFEQYKDKISQFIIDLNKKQKEFELKYITPGNVDEYKEKVINKLLEDGWSILSQTDKCNNDIYYDTENFDLLSNGGSLRIREAIKDGKSKFKGTYKMPTGQGSVYSDREEIEEDLKEPTVEELISKQKGANTSCQILDKKLIEMLNATTNRCDVIFERDGVEISVSFDKTHYQNLVVDNEIVQADDNMIEIEMLSDNRDRIVLNDLYQLFSKDEDLQNLKLNHENKYFRGMGKTTKKIKEKAKEREKKLLKDLEEQEL